jgi:hypothetical protein
MQDMRSVLTSLIGKSLFIATLAMPAFAEEVACPPTLEVQQKASVPAGWEGKEYFTPFLQRMEAYQRTSAPDAMFPPDEGDQSHELWHLKPTEQWWMACYYHGTTIVLHRKLPLGMTECRIDYDAARFRLGNKEVKRAACH